MEGGGTIQDLLEEGWWKWSTFSCKGFWRTWRGSNWFSNLRLCPTLSGSGKKKMESVKVIFFKFHTIELWFWSMPVLWGFTTGGKGYCWYQVCSKLKYITCVYLVNIFFMCLTIVHVLFQICNQSIIDFCPWCFMCRVHRLLTARACFLTWFILFLTNGLIFKPSLQKIMTQISWKIKEAQ